MDFQEIFQGIFDTVIWLVNFIKDFVYSITGEDNTTTTTKTEKTSEA